MVEHGASNAKIMGLIPRESKSWSNVKKTVTWMQCKSLWIKASAKCINVNVTINAPDVIFIKIPNCWSLILSEVTKIWRTWLHFCRLWRKHPTGIWEQEMLLFIYKLLHGKSASHYLKLPDKRAWNDEEKRLANSQARSHNFFFSWQKRSSGGWCPTLPPAALESTPE